MDDVRRLLVPAKFILGLLHLNPDEDTNRAKLIFISFMVLSLPICIGEFIFIFRNIREILKVSLAIATVPSILEGIIKYATLFIHRRKMWKFIYNVERNFWSVDIADDESKKSILDEARKVKFIAIFFVSVMIITIVFFTLLPGPTFFQKQPIFPVDFVFFNSEQSPYFEIILVFQAILIAYVAPIITGSCDMLFIFLIENVIAQLKIIGCVLRSIESDGDADIRKLNKCVYHYSFILRFSKSLQEFYKWVILLQYMSTIITMCFAFFVIGSVNNVVTAICFAGFVAGHGMEMLIMCFAGSEFIHQYHALSFAAYSAGWHSCSSKRIRTSLQMLMISAQNARSFTGGHIFDLNLGNFINIIRFSFSVRTLLAKKLLEQNE